MTMTITAKYPSRYAVSLPDGTVVARTSASTYTHVVVARHNVGEIDVLSILGWCGSPDLARKLAAAAQGARFSTEADHNASRRGKRQSFTGGLLWSDVTVVAVDRTCDRR